MNFIRPFSGIEHERFGSKHDGGYVVPKRIMANCRFLISYGYGHDSNFERQFLKISKSNKVQLYDYSINSKILIRNLTSSIFNRLKIKAGISFPLYRLKILVRYLGLKLLPRLSYYNLKISKLTDKRLNKISIADSLEKISTFSNFILKIDIEGDEYPVINDTLQEVNLAAVVVIEFHDISENLSEFVSLIKNLKKNFFISNSHINNFTNIEDGLPKTLELTLINLRYWNSEGKMKSADRIPSVLDSPNNPKSPEYLYDFKDC